ncbi:MAG: MAPEG family protein [Pseudomonadota bacterium]
MKSTLIYWPMLVQMMIPLIVLALNGKRKAADRRSGSHDPAESAINNTAWTLPVVLTSNNLANQFQFPIVFYGLCLILAHIGGVTMVTLGLAWAYVVGRVFHAYVHVTSNHIPKRFGSFITTMLILLGFFIATVIQLAKVS